ncbi:MAG: hypothetical protein ABSE18_00570 [Minisyncoccia bacterium]|jgi:hypothetical protein
MRKKFKAILALIALGILFGLQYHALQAPGVQQRLYADIHDTPAIVFYPIVIALFLSFVGPTTYLLLNEKRWRQNATEHSVMNAKIVASSLWCVGGKPMITDEGTTVRFNHFSWPSRSFILPVRPGHPDITRFGKLHEGNTVEFEALPEVMECSLEHELCGYLRIRSVS